MTKYIVGVYGPLGTMDIRWVRLTLDGNHSRFVDNKKNASRFKTLARAVAYSKGITATGTYGAIVEPVTDERER